MLHPNDVRLLSKLVMPQPKADMEVMVGMVMCSIPRLQHKLTLYQATALAVEMDKGDVPTWKFTFQLGDMQGATY